ncbi:hypothetical protein SAMN05428959_10817 [Duganella sp. CF517]|uniref:hypothetical protein n=1 Tax=Duganella sp. CF517 TaxID=1881038 RepID=UPI0008CCB7DC|nr:hypothetical protein [Duganella sp. CF517]SEO43809.1 hypothetical protein SAMN05428959_10817 [Duganella sp. CF517]
MRQIIALSLLLAALVGCQQSSSSPPAAKATDAAAASNTATPTKFEIRDFSLDEQKQSYGGIIYKGRGTLVTKDVVVNKGNYMVWVTAKQAHKNDDVWKGLVLMHDGIGTIETSDYQSKDEIKQAKYYDWKILGYAALSSGVIEQESATVAK